MKAFLLSIFSFCIIMNAAYSQKTVSQEVVLDSETYKELKSSGELLNETYTIIDPNEGVSEHVTVYATNEAERDGPCDCWIEPDETYTTAPFAANFTDDGSTANIAFPFDFELYGETYNDFWINTNGNVTFDQANGTFTATGFPANVVMLAPFWADVDFGCADCGTLRYKVTDNAVYVNWEEVGYFPGSSDLLNSFQLIFTLGDSGVLTEGNNVQFCYGDMQWTTGSASGGQGGFGGTAATVGANAGDNANYIQFGRFDQPGEAFDGALGANDGVSWLDDKTLEFSTDFSVGENIPPIGAGLDFCETIVMCTNETEILNFTFLTPEPDQTITIELEGVEDLDVETVVTGGSDAAVELIITTSDDQEAGLYSFIITATDDGEPAASTSLEVNVEILPISIPDLSITSDGLLVDTLSYCQGIEGVPLEASLGFDSLLWSNNYPLETGIFSQGSYTVTGFFDQCDTEAGPVVIFQIPVFSPDWSATDLLLCEGDSSVITFDDADEFPIYTWSLPTNDGEILSEDSLNNTITVTSGLYNVSVVDENGCTGSSVIVVNEEILNLQQANFPQAQCDDNTITWTGSWADPNACTMVIFMADSDADSWEGAFLEAYVDGAGPFTFGINDAFPFVGTGQDLFHGQTIEFFWNPGIDDDDIRVQLFEPGDNTNEIFDTDDGDLLIAGEDPFFTFTADCGYNCLPGTWTASPDVGEFSDPNCYNPVVDDQPTNQVFTAPEGYIGTITLSFLADICEVAHSFDVEFSTPPVASVTSANECGDVQATLFLTIEPAELIGTGININWTPNGSPNADGDTIATYNNTTPVTVVVDNICGESITEGMVEILPIPNPQLSNTTICDGTSLTLNPIGAEDPSYEYLWTTGSTNESIAVTEAGPYSVTVSNDCGTETSTLDVSVTPVPSVLDWAFDTLLCAGDEIVIDPIWSEVPEDGPITWSLSYLDLDSVFVQMPYENTSTELLLGSEMVPAEANSSVVLSYSYFNSCGTANGDVIIIPDLCFVEPIFISAYNVISPDSDGAESAAPGQSGLNEGWQIIGIEEFSNVDVKIFDRWGSLVYESSNYKNLTPWRGQDMNGNDLADGVYFYTVYVPGADKELNGSVTVLRKQ